MEQRPIAVVVDWYGPYSFSEAKSVAKMEFSKDIYVAIGKQKYQKRPSQIQYVGIAGIGTLYQAFDSRPS